VRLVLARHSCVSVILYTLSGTNSQETKKLNAIVETIKAANDL